MEIIGVNHHEDRIPHIIDYVEVEHGDSLDEKSVALEVHPIEEDWYRQNPDGNFYGVLIKHFSERVREIFLSDTARYDGVLGRIEKEITKFNIAIDRRMFLPNTSLPIQLALLAVITLGSCVKTPLNMYTAFSSKRTRARDEAFVESFHSNNPDIAIIGMRHALQIKQLEPSFNITILHDDIDIMGVGSKIKIEQLQEECEHEPDKVLMIGSDEWNERYNSASTN